MNAARGVARSWIGALGTQGMGRHGMRERVSGRLGGRPEENWGSNDHHWVGFQLCVDGFEEGPLWYSVHCGGHALADFALQRLEKGQRVVVEGETEMKSWTDKTGKSRLKRFLRAFILELPGGDRVEGRPDETPKPPSPETVEKSYKAWHEEHLKEYPLRWDKPFVGEVIRQAQASDPEAWTLEMEGDPDALVSEEQFKGLIARLVGGQVRGRVASGEGG